MSFQNISLDFGTGSNSLKFDFKGFWCSSLDSELITSKYFCGQTKSREESQNSYDRKNKVLALKIKFCCDMFV